MKKLGAFLLILVGVLTLVVTTLGDFLYGAFFPERTQQKGTQYALTLDDSGLAYYVENVGGVNRIVKADDLGNIIVDEELPVMTDASSFVVQNLYVTQDHYIYAAGFEADLVRRTAKRALVIVMDDNGSLYAIPFDKPIVETAINLPRMSALFSGMSEDDDRVYFAYANERQATVYAHDKSDPAVVDEIRVCELTKPLTAMFAVQDGRLIAADQDGTVWMNAEEGSSMCMGSSGLMHTYSMAYATSESCYFHNAQTGGVGQFYYESGAVTSVVSGDMALEGGGRFDDFTQVAMGARGRLAGVHYDGENYTLYIGSESRMASVPTVQRSVFNSDKMISIAILVGALLMTVLIWDIYISLLKMRVGVLVRQALLTGIVLVILCYVLLHIIIAPQLSETMLQMVRHQVSTASRVMAAELSALEDEARIASLQQAKVEVLSPDGSQIPVHMSLVHVSERTTLAASNESSLTGLSYNAIPYNADLDSLIHRAMEQGEEINLETYALGTDMIAATRAGQEYVVIAALNAGNIDAAVQVLLRNVSVFLIAVCAALFIALLVIESLTVRSLRRLRRGVDAVSAGNYDVEIKVSSGDEVENLSHAFMAMARKIRNNTEQLTDVSSSYYRFVPENLVQLLGETSIEKVGKSTYVEKTMTVLMLKFTIMDDSASQTTGELFRNINNVIESLSPAVAECDGTVYDFSADGFIAVFERATDAVRAALRIRETAMSLNDTRRQQNLCTVDVRVALSSGDVMLGVVGDEKRMAPTVISDVIAMSQRLIELQRPSNVYVLCTGDIIASARGYRTRRIGLYMDQGKEIQLFDIYEGDPFQLLKDKESTYEKYNEALRLYENGDMAEARLRFLHIVKITYDDGVARNYLYCADNALAGRGQRGYHVM